MSEPLHPPQLPVAVESRRDFEDADAVRERALLDRLRAGDADALGELYDAHGARVHAVAARIDRESADDVTHEVFLKLWRHAGRFRGGARLSTWLHRLALNSAIDQARRRSVRRAVDLDAIPELPTTDSDDPSVSLDVAAALAALPPRLRWPVLLRYWGGLDYAEIAQALRCREGTVASRLSRALARMGERLGARADRRLP